MGNDLIKGFPSTSGNDVQLNTISFAKGAARTYPEVEVVSRRIDGSLFRYNYQEAYGRIQQLAKALAKEINKPLLIDGDGITALCEDLQIIEERKAETILTPHLGEMSRVTKRSVSEIDTNKIDVLQETAKELNAMIVLKGAHSLIGYPDERVFINMSGNSGMATAGSGDVLAGAIAATIREGELPDVQAIGPHAVNQAIKAVALARRFLAEEDIDIICVPEFIEVMIGDEERTAVRLAVERR